MATRLTEHYDTDLKPKLKEQFGYGATFPDGNRSGTVSVTVVHADKIPMAPNFGQQPRFIVTIQPAGVLFDPPAPITLPNVDGLSPGEITEMYSFDHDLGQFVSIGTGSVSEDGTVIASDPGVGIIKGGWHCGGNPALVGTVADCPDCQICQINGCVPDDSQIPQNICTMCQGGSSVNKPDGPIPGEQCDFCQAGQRVTFHDGDPNSPPIQPPQPFVFTPYDNNNGIFDPGVDRLITSDFGWRTLSGISDFHGGFDIDTTGGENLHASTNIHPNATISCVGTNCGFPGSTVIINNGGGEFEVYAEMGAVASNISAGDPVSPGQIIGVGAGGSGSHLHWARFQTDPNNPVINDQTAVNVRPDILPPCP